MIYESNSNFIVDYGDSKFNALKDATLYIKLDTESKTIITVILEILNFLLKNLIRKRKVLHEECKQTLHILEQ